MVRKYIPREIEAKCQAHWAEEGLYHAREDSARPKWYFLTMLPYTSGDLHIGHWYAMAPSDAKARYTRMRGYNVMFPIGFDAFGLPAENAALERGIHPYEWTMSNIENMRGQLRSMGAMWDWEREAITCLPEYYKWTQWLFLQFYRKGLAYRTKAPVDWCPKCNTSLAREQVWGEDRHCERCGTPVGKKELEQWLLRITDYAEELLDFTKLQWPERVITMQRNWIGRSVGVEFNLGIEGSDKVIPVFTTRPDTVYGTTFAVLAPEHPLVEELTKPECREEVETYRLAASRQTEIERLAAERERTGVFIGSYATNPMNGERVPIYVADYVMMGYGTGAIMGVPAHDTRDFEFAKRYELPIPVVIAPPDWKGEELEEAYLGEGLMVNSGPFDGLPSPQGWQAVADHMEEHGIGQRKVNYRLRDWLISRQRYWGAPIPIIYCPRCGTVPVPEEDLPVLLPQDAEFLPTGESPLKFHQGFLHTTCPKCRGPAERETDTMDTFICSSWYQYRYISPHYDKGPFDPDKGRYWLPVDQYTGGIEHATMHLLYTRFFTKAMRDMGLVDFDEPMIRLYNQGMLLGEDGQKMSKSRGNVVNPDEYVRTLGADAVRAFLMFIGPWELGGNWSSTGIQGIYRFLNRVWDLIVTEPQPTSAQSSPEQVAALRRVTHQSIRKVTEDMEAFRFNTMVAALMKFANYLTKAKETAVVNSDAWPEALRTLVLLMAPTTPHIAEELWQELDGGDESVHAQPWPEWNAELAAEDMFTLPVQVNGKMREKLQAPVGIDEQEALELSLSNPSIQRRLQDKVIVRTIYIPNRLLNIVTK